MPTIYEGRSVGELVREDLSRARVFERHHIDYCCGGQRPLADACREAGVGVEKICEELAKNDDDTDHSETDWATAALSQLADHIVERHHKYVASELPRLGALLERVVVAHGEAHPEIVEVKQIFAGLQRELQLHMMKEEQVLFPIVKQMEQAQAESQPLPAAPCGSVNNPITAMEDEHRYAGDALRKIRELTANFSVPEGVCDTYRVLLDGLEKFESDLHLHIHKENNILFPRAAELEAAISTRA